MIPLPTSGIAAVSRLGGGAARRGRRYVLAAATAQAAFDLPELDLPVRPVKPRLRLVTGTDTRLDRIAARFAQAVVEVVGGDRGVFQLLRWTTDEVYHDVVRRSAALDEAVPPLRSRRLRAQVRSVHLSVPRPEVAELSIHVRHGARSRAIAARLEVVDGRWKCSALEFGP